MEEITKITKDELLQLLYEAYQAGCYGFMELKEAHCVKAVEQRQWLPPEPVVQWQVPQHSSYTISIDSGGLPPQQQQRGFILGGE